jgi:hypothetical protein
MQRRRIQRSGPDLGLGDGQDRARRIAEHVLADGAQHPRYPAGAGTILTVLLPVTPEDH